MFGRDDGFWVPAAAVAMAEAEGRENRVELFVGERRSAEEDERTENREGGSADMRVCDTDQSWLSDHSVVVLEALRYYSEWNGSLRHRIPMNSLVSSPVPRPSEFQAHIYNSLLQGRTSDVALRIRASWDAVYNFHRVVLIQAVRTLCSFAQCSLHLHSFEEFFRDLFTGGFVESESNDFSQGSRISSGPIEVVFDDANITRAGTWIALLRITDSLTLAVPSCIIAFEYVHVSFTSYAHIHGLYRLCIARLYGGGPPLFIDPAIVPTPSHPLTPSFPNPPSPTHVPLGHQPATPRFLMSLLAVSIYLCMPSLTAETLSNITSTIGPFTVMDYLRFAYGEGIGSLQEGDLDPLVGLEHVAHVVKAESVDCNQLRTQGKDVECFSRNLEALSVEDQIHSSQGGASLRVGQSIEKEDPAEHCSEPGSSTFVPGETGSNLSFSYGSVSDKIGEACVCWLARWGADILVLEQEAGGLSKKPVPYSDVNDSPLPQPPLIWRRGGLTATWARALISSDLLFVKSERERYDLAKAVVELCRNEGILEEEEVEWAKLFTEGIYYANMVRLLAR